MNRKEALAEDSRLVLAAQRGDREAFGALVRKYAGVVRALVAARLGWGPDVDDTAQEVFLQAYRRLESVADPERFAGWISRIAVNSALQELRRRGRRPSVSLDAVDVDPPARPEHDRLETADELSRTLEAIAGLDEKTQLVLALRLREGLAVKEIAARLGDNPPAVAMRISRALRGLRKRLETER